MAKERKSKKRKRRLWLNIKARGVSVTKREFIRTLVESIDREDYELPTGWDVRLEWRNKEGAEMKSGAWGEELRKSRESSDGFDRAVTKWLRRKGRGRRR